MIQLVSMGKLRKADEQGEILDHLGQDSEEKGAKAAIDYHKGLQKIQKKADENFLEDLESKRRSKETYYKSILAEARIRALEFTVPKNCQWKFGISEKGLALYIYSGGHTYAQGMKVTGAPEDDAKGIQALIVMGLEYMEILESQWKKIQTN
jgi:hypothetical protein